VGEYIGKYFHKYGADITGVVGTTEETARQAAGTLKKYGIDAIPFTDFKRLIDKQRPDTVVIASPIRTHYAYLMASVEAGVNVFCEKPFVWHETDDIEKMLRCVFGERRKGTTIAMNSQWPFSLPYYEELVEPVDPRSAQRFDMKLSPVSGGKEMIPDSVPHALSVLYRVFGEGTIKRGLVEFNGEKMITTFAYLSGSGTCECRLTLTRTQAQPRPFEYGFNGRVVRRVIDMENYDVYLCYGDRRMELIDPLELSVKDFIGAVHTGDEPLIGPSHIITTTLLLRTIYEQSTTGYH